jgi:hypothetical protein
MSIEELLMLTLRRMSRNADLEDVVFVGCESEFPLGIGKVLSLIERVASSVGHLNELNNLKGCN